MVKNRPGMAWSKRCIACTLRLLVQDNNASGRVEDPRSFFKNIHNVNVFEKEKKEYHAATGDSAVHRVKCPV